MELPKSRKGRETRRKTIDGKPLIYTVMDDFIFKALSDDRKAFSIQKLKFEDDHEEYRIMYYMIAEKPRMKGKWAFGQFAPMMTKSELKMIFDLMREKGWI